MFEALVHPLRQRPRRENCVAKREAGARCDELLAVSGSFPDRGGQRQAYDFLNAKS